MELDGPAADEHRLTITLTRHVIACLREQNEGVDEFAAEDDRRSLPR
jgi:hypothetical protein